MDRVARPRPPFEPEPDPRRLPTRAQAEFMAEAFLHRHGVRRPPVFLLELAQQVKIIDVSIGDITQSALLHAVPGGLFAVILRRLDGAQRQRFSLAHEIGHRILHPAYTARHELEPVAARRDVSRLERTVDHFAACLLMPRGWFAPRMREGASVAELAREFDVSLAAAQARIRELSR
jgi:Zn-dependent peptidase ImmA (M78 family)